MKIELGKLLDRLPSTEKSSTKTKRKKKQQQEYATLGDRSRFDGFPDSVDEKFISMYRDGLDEFLVPYIQYGEMNVREAHSFIEKLVDQIFGNYNHYGIFSYLRERNYENQPERELVRTAEKLISTGWSIRKDKNTGRYKLYNNEKAIVIDVTGKSDFYEESESALLDEDSAHLFIDSQDASKIESLARSLGMSADELNEVDSLASLIPNTNDREIIGHIRNYQKLRNILSRQSSYGTTSKGLTANDLHEEGYVLSHRMVYSNEDFSVLEKDRNLFLIKGVVPEVNTLYTLNKDLLMVLSSKIKNQLFKRVSSIYSQDVTEIKELERVFAIMTEHLDNDLIYLSYGDMVDLFKRMDTYVSNGEITKTFYRKIVGSIAQVVATEAVLLGNRWFSISGMTMESVSGKSYVYPNNDAFSSSLDELNEFTSSYTDGTRKDGILTTFTNSVYPFRFDSEVFREHAGTLFAYLPSEYFSELSKLDFDFEGYGMEFSGLKEYLNAARSFLVSLEG